MTHQKDRTHCIRGHELSGDNLYLRTEKDGRTRRQCRKCRAEAKVRNKQELLKKVQEWVPK